MIWPETRSVWVTASLMGWRASVNRSATEPAAALMCAVPVAMSLLRSESPCDELGELVQAFGELVVARGEGAQHGVQVLDDLADELIAARQRRLVSAEVWASTDEMVPP